ncbi:hypothetical protein nbrc107696_08360 [Gordonia spumicola]|uniref:Uncharacterized protein n=1 Tax=Gordonia spumicola TaxID=589161 RepID=A0A7I9V5Q2_9ACTN|nr:hypothetical protein [Gordonia spumicola]GEE00390.1 hypothetical protein nbrc107696_08360 [Gordonia spumicola]
MQKLDARQIVPLTSEELNQLRKDSNTQEITPGLYSRALLLHAIDNMTADEITDAVAVAKTEAADRLSAGAREAVSHRWEK